MDSELVPGRKVLYRRVKTGEYVPATITGTSKSENCVILEYEVNGQPIINDRARMDHIHLVRSPSCSRKRPRSTSASPCSTPSRSSPAPRPRSCSPAPRSRSCSPIESPPEEEEMPTLLPVSQAQPTTNLPPGWEQLQTEDGTAYYINHAQKKTQWTAPQALPAKPSDDDVEIVWAKADRGVWGLGHVFDGQLYFTRDIVDSSVLKDSYKLPRRKEPPAPPPKPAPKPAPKSGKKRKRGACSALSHALQARQRLRIRGHRTSTIGPRNNRGHTAPLCMCMSFS